MNKCTRLLVVTVALICAIGCGRPTKVPVVSVGPSATADSLVYIADRAGTVRAIGRDGKEQWSYKLAGDLSENGVAPDLRIDSLAARSGGALYVLATKITGPSAGTVELCGLNGNHMIWHREAREAQPGINPIAVDSGAIYLSGDNGTLFAYSRADGQLKWKFTVSQGALGSPLVSADGTIYVTGPGHNLHAISPDGVEEWKAETHEEGY